MKFDEQQEKEARDLIKKYFSLFKRQNKYIYKIDDMWVYTSMIESDILKYYTCIEHSPIHIVNFKDDKFEEVFFKLFPDLINKDFSIELKVLNTIINKASSLNNLKLKDDGGLLYITNVPHVKSKQGTKLKDPKDDVPENQINYENILIGNYINKLIKESIKNIIDELKQHTVFLKPLEIEEFVNNETFFVRFKENDLNEYVGKDKKSTNINIPIWDGESSVSVCEFVKKMKYEKDPEILLNIYIINDHIKHSFLYKAEDIDVLSLHRRIWFPFILK
jgi:hypothetical protein